MTFLQTFFPTEPLYISLRSRKQRMGRRIAEGKEYQMFTNAQHYPPSPAKGFPFPWNVLLPTWTDPLTDETEEIYRWMQKLNPGVFPDRTIPPPPSNNDRETNLRILRKAFPDLFPDIEEMPPSLHSPS